MGRDHGVHHRQVQHCELNYIMCRWCSELFIFTWQQHCCGTKCCTAFPLPLAVARRLRENVRQQRISCIAHCPDRLTPNTLYRNHIFGYARHSDLVLLFSFIYIISAADGMVRSASMHNLFQRHQHTRSKVCNGANCKRSALNTTI